ncbi:MAG: 4'-phosphopantetheinyl transferase superfamily protein [Balneolaceae bacterium]|nr:MAG: 4'-phosphopantetheinyl transferase superfamily protein [Balneolaceae bacterium]
MNYDMDLKLEQVFERLQHPSLPEDIIVAYEPLDVDISGGDIDASESITGSILIKKSADAYLGIEKIDVFTQKYEKPKAFVNGEELSVSFSHTNGALATSISWNMNVGIDMEEKERKINSRLLSRMKHPEESDLLYEETDLIRIWTLKEAALKMIGTGLRKPMNGTLIKKIDKNSFIVQFDDGKQGKICSFQHQDHWISICYHNNAVT